MKRVIDLDPDAPAFEFSPPNAPYVQPTLPVYAVAAAPVVRTVDCSSLRHLDVRSWEQLPMWDVDGVRQRGVFGLVKRALRDIRATRGARGKINVPHLLRLVVRLAGKPTIRRPSEEALIALLRIWYPTLETKGTTPPRSAAEAPVPIMCTATLVTTAVLPPTPHLAPYSQRPAAISAAAAAPVTLDGSSDVRVSRRAKAKAKAKTNTTASAAAAAPLSNGTPISDADAAVEILAEVKSGTLDPGTLFNRLVKRGAPCAGGKASTMKRLQCRTEFIYNVQNGQKTFTLEASLKLSRKAAAVAAKKAKVKAAAAEQAAAKAAARAPRTKKETKAAAKAAAKVAAKAAAAAKAAERAPRTKKETKAAANAAAKAAAKVAAKAAATAAAGKAATQTPTARGSAAANVSGAGAPDSLWERIAPQLASEKTTRGSVSKRAFVKGTVEFNFAKSVVAVLDATQTGTMEPRDLEIALQRCQTKYPCRGIRDALDRSVDDRIVKLRDWGGRSARGGARSAARRTGKPATLCAVRFLLFTVTFHANLAHNLTCSP